MPKIKNFIDQLRNYSSSQVFNPWKDYDTSYDIGSDAPEIRRQHLNKYLRLRIPNVKYIFIAEALGFQGGHFSGIAMTSERILLGNNPSVKPASIIGEVGKRTSNAKSLYERKETERKFGFAEPTATVVWGEILKSSLSPFEVVLWNIFPFHPYKLEGLLTNRPPESHELKDGLAYVKMLLKLCPNAKIVSIGQSSAVTLKKNGIDSVKLRHPSNGGTPEFRSGFKQNFL
jgi:hypothetical protein